MSHTQTLRYYLLPLVLAAALSSSVQTVHAQAGNPPATQQPPAVATPPSANAEPQGYGLINPLRSTSIPQIIGTVVSWLGSLAGGLFFFYLLWGAFEWMTSRGSGDGVKSGMKKIEAALWGIGVIAFAYLAVATIIELIP
jgi:hypothetical protein